MTQVVLPRRLLTVYAQTRMLGLPLASDPRFLGVVMTYSTWTLPILCLCRQSTVTLVELFAVSTGLIIR